MRKQHVLRATAAVGAVFGLAACDQPTDSGFARDDLRPAAVVTFPTASEASAGALWVCKDSPESTPFSFTYTVDAEVGGGVVTEIGSPFDVDPGECVEVLTVDNSMGSQSATATVTETDPDNLFIDADVYYYRATNPGAGYTFEYADATNGTQERVTNDRGVLIVFNNGALPVGGDEGCTPGYWKNHTGSWAATGYSTGQTLESVFDVPDAFGLDDVTLLNALGFGGGPGALGGAKILLRAAVAALLNASHPDVDYTRSEADIIADVNAALASNDRNTMLVLAEALDTDNNLGCPLN